MATDTDVIIIDEPLPRVRRITMNRPDKRNSLIHTLRGAILDSVVATKVSTCRTTHPKVRARGPAT
jgi:enoyl-CoA hydratase/carnithine racemase